MYSKLPELVFGFHGCDQSVFDRVIKNGEPLDFSTNDYDWLGSGIYFWENSVERAWEWARESGRVKEPAVIGAVIDLGHCLNLTDRKYTDLLASEYEIMKIDYDEEGTPLPKNTGKTQDKLLRKLDCAVIEHLHQFYDDTDQRFDSARGLFSEGDPIYPDSKICEKTHIQICVRNPNCIKGYFEPRQMDVRYQLP